MKARPSPTLLLLLLTIVVCTGFAQDSTIFLIRHAEKISSAKDALLSPAGEKRAECLANMLKDANIQTIYATEVRRTQQTAEPLAKKLNLQVTVVSNHDQDKLIQMLRKQRGNALVVGHSDTTPQIIEKLGGGKLTIGDNEFDAMLVVTLHGKTAQVTELHYCDGP